MKLVCHIHKLYSREPVIIRCRYGLSITEPRPTGATFLLFIYLFIYFIQSCAIINKAMVMSDLEISAMAKAATDYYENYLAPTTSIQALLNHQTRRISLRLLPFLKAGGGFA